MVEKLALLFAAADTHAQKGYGIDTGKEYQYINEAFTKATCYPLFGLDVNNIGPKLAEYTPAVLHISAHGTINGKLVVEEGIEAELKIDAGRFTSFLADYQKHLQLVVFCVCHSGSMAKKVIEHLPVSIGFEDKLDDEVAKSFSRRFYQLFNENPNDSYGAYLRTKKEIELGDKKGKARLYFNRSGKYRWNAAAWKRVLRVLHEKERLVDIVSKAGLSAKTPTHADNYLEVLYYNALNEDKLFALRDAIDDEVLQRVIPELIGFEEELAIPAGYAPMADSKAQAVRLQMVKKDRSLAFWQRWFSFAGRRKKQEIALKRLNIFDHNELQHIKEDLDGYLTLFYQEESGRPAEFVHSFAEALNNEKSKKRFYLLLGDTGIGKTTALINLFAHFATTQRNYSIVFAPFDKGLNPIYNLDNPEKTILLLDGIDEAPQALADANAFFTEVEQNTRNFAKVVISCRTQFFERQADEREKTNTRPPNRYVRIRLQPLEMDAIRREAGKIYSPEREREKYQKALAVVRRSGNLFRRPLLLGYLKEMVERPGGFLFLKTRQEEEPFITSYEVYEVIIRNWIEREQALAHGFDGDYGAELFDTSLQLALHLYKREKKHGPKVYIHYADLKEIPGAVEGIYRRSHSLLHRNSEGFYRFAHRTFKEFFYAHLLYEGLIPESEFPFEFYEDTARFYWEMSVVQYFRNMPEGLGRGYAPRQEGFYSGGPLEGSCAPVLTFASYKASEFDPPDCAYGLFRRLTLELDQFYDQDKKRNGRLDCFTDIAEYIVKNEESGISEGQLRDICRTYEIYVADLLRHFFFGQAGGRFCFLHRSFAEFFLLRDAISETDEESWQDAFEHFPFDKLRFTRLFSNEIQWLRLRQQHAALQLQLDNRTVSDEERRARQYDSWAEYMQEKSVVKFSEFEGYIHRLEQSGRIRVNYQRQDWAAVLSVLPLPGKIACLDISHNNVTGGLELSRFVNLEVIDVSGNPSLSLSASKLPDSLRRIILADEKERVVTEGLIAGNFPNILVSRNGNPGFGLPEAPFREPEMVEVQGGRFWMGSGDEDKEAYEREKPLHLVRLPDYRIGKYAVTVEEFSYFIKDAGYVTTAEKEGWSGAAYWTIKENRDYLTWLCRVNCNWRHDVYGEPINDTFSRHPVVHVSLEIFYPRSGFFLEKRSAFRKLRTGHQS